MFGRGGDGRGGGHGDGGGGLLGGKFGKFSFSGELGVGGACGCMVIDV